ncbi:MAG: hypothetical protein ACE5JJ_03370 [Nitrospinota bacterium]
MFGQTVDIVIRQAPCDLAVAKLGTSPALKRILLPTAGGPHARLAARLAPILAREFNAQVTSAYYGGRVKGWVKQKPPPGRHPSLFPIQLI